MFGVDTVQTIFLVAKQIYDKAQLAKVNKQECIELASRVKVIEDAIRGLDIRKENNNYEKGLNRLLEKLQNCLSFINELSRSASIFARVLNFAKAEERNKKFSALNVALTNAVGDLGIGLHNQKEVSERRGSILINLTHIFDEKERKEYVLDRLKKLFSEQRDEGLKTENYDIYNKYLKDSGKNIELIYKTRENKHVLEVDGEALTTFAAKKEISEMMLPQFTQATRPFPQANRPLVQVNASDVTVFLRLVSEGEQEKAEAMIKRNPALVLVPGDVTDLSKRTFTNITGFQYAVWALDWHMWMMIRKYLPDESAREQAQGFETGTWARQHSVHANLNTLIQAYQTTDDLYKARKYDEGDKAWVQQVGGAQLLLPAHVINEYCHPTRPFYPLPNFKDASALPRTRKVGYGEWFTAVYDRGTLGDKFAIHRGYRKAATDAGGYCVRLAYNWEMDYDCIRALTITRIAQREELIAELRPGSVQRLVV